METLLQVAQAFGLRLSPIDGSITFVSNFGLCEMVDWEPGFFGLYFNRASYSTIHLLRPLGCKVVHRGDEDVLLMFSALDAEKVLGRIRGFPQLS